MAGMNDILDYKVITPKGPRWVRSLHHGDQIFEYGTGKMLTFYGQELKKIGSIYEVVYTDRRSMLVNGSDKLYVGDGKIVPLDVRIRNSAWRRFFTREAIEHKPVNYRGFGPHPNWPDPYVTGALWFAGDWEDPEINTSLTAGQANMQLMNKYNIEYVDRIRKGKVYFRYIDSDHVLRWDEFFKGIDWYPVTMKKESDIIPRHIEFGKNEDRRQFLRGVFDVGYQQNGGDGRLYLHHQSEGRLRALQRMMWGMGILSIVSLLKRKSELDPQVYSLSIIDDKWRYPGFLYQTEKIEQEIIYERHVNLIPEFKLMIYNIQHPQGPAPMSRGVVPSIRVNKPGAVFYDGNYLPRVAL